MNWIDIGPVDIVAEGEVAAADAKGVPLALFRKDGHCFALHDLCTHGQARLSDGFVEDGCIECPLHQGLFDIETGEPRSAPVTEAVRSFPAREHDGRIQVALDGEGNGD
ncbi:anthranilate 1,2-dioxygenase ferredoxin subunit AndAb [Sphingomonas sp.]|uniref:anthranilate 1,2-dioxygenase ferredoxin subunit AndAb n=1 Tax=Sphingomonas sp. TaxID=28214 RepID=UPI000DB2B756|nr:anthranilate 1,2-dioxygenase ferredoxin subunit AndAb [Sphingomonas sp.]PZU10787.1 MAG: Rieske (2Fe-2S) protein [Sphingomonas sp.]